MRSRNVQGKQVAELGAPDALQPRMTAPRQVIPGATYLVTRRCTQRQFLLKPCKIVNEVFLYVLALAAKRYGIRIHSFCVLSNHSHIVLSDPHARLPAFQQYLDSLVALALNTFHGRCENFWAPDTYSAVMLGSTADVIDKITYVLANPVAAGLVRHGRQWPGLWSAPEQIDTVIEVRRPEHFFDAGGSLPKTVSLKLSRPRGFDSTKAFRRDLSTSLADREQKAARACEGRFLGIAKVLAQPSSSRPRSIEPRRGLNPRIGAGDKWKRIELLQDLADFLRAYRDAWLARRSGRLGTIFPFGTYQLRVLHGAPCVGFG
jgi:REP element-mobilizing transposase RayT